MKYSYKNSLKSNISDEFINVVLQRPVAGIIIFFLYYTPITPNQVTLISTLFGIAGGILLAIFPANLFTAAIFLYLKDIFDSADGQLARAKKLFSRRGRFYDSIGDFIVNIFLWGGIFFWIQQQTEFSFIFSIGICAAGFLGVNLRVSYHVYYQTAFLHRQEQYQTNRLSEEVRAEDLQQDSFTLILQKIFLLLYGWQDSFIKFIDQKLLGSKKNDTQFLERWYSNRISLFLNGLIGIGTEFVGATVCLLFFGVQEYLLFSAAGLTILWVAAILFRLMLRENLFVSFSR